MIFPTHCVSVDLFILLLSTCGTAVDELNGSRMLQTIQKGFRGSCVQFTISQSSDDRSDHSFCSAFIFQPTSITKLSIIGRCSFLSFLHAILSLGVSVYRNFYVRQRKSIRDLVGRSVGWSVGR